MFGFLCFDLCYLSKHVFFFSDFMSDFKTDDDFLDQSMDFGDLPPDPEAVRGFFYELLFLF